jgi:hypothetical protein
MPRARAAAEKEPLCGDQKGSRAVPVEIHGAPFHAKMHIIYENIGNSYSI